MIITDPKVYPLEEMLQAIPDDGLPIDQESLHRMALFMNAGGVICEEYGEVLEALKYLEEWTNIIRFDILNGNLILRKNIHGY